MKTIKKVAKVIACMLFAIAGLAGTTVFGIILYSIFVVGRTF